jgi:hypothetical protein
MQPRLSNRATTAVLATSAALTLGFAPAVTPEPQPEPASSSQAGQCLEGYAYVNVFGTPYGRTSTWCIWPTDCSSTAGFGPANHSVGALSAHHYTKAPKPNGMSELTCYV